MFAHVEGDITIEEAYIPDGTENIIFLMQNKSDDEVTVSICLDERESDIITVLPASEIEVDLSDAGEINSGSADGDAISSETIQETGAAGNGGGSSSFYSAGNESEIIDEPDSPAAVIEIDNSDDDLSADSITEDSSVHIDEGTTGSEKHEEADGAKDSETDTNENDADTGSDKKAVSGNSDEKDGSPDEVSKSSNGKDEESSETDKGIAGSGENSPGSDNASGNDNSSDDDDSEKNESGGTSSDSDNSSEKPSENASGRPSDNASDRSDKGRGKGKEKSDSSAAGKDGAKDAGEKTASVSRHNNNLLTAEKASASDVMKASASDALPNDLDGIIYDPVRVDKNGAVAFEIEMTDYYTGFMLLDATQVLEASGSVDVYDRDSDSEPSEYILYVTDAPTNTEINLDSPHITLKYRDGKELAGIVLDRNLTYVSDTGEETSVEYLMFDDDAEEVDNDYILTPYDENNEALDMSSGRLVITIPDNIDAVYIWKIQTNTLCYQDENGVYQTEIIEATEASEPVLCDLEDYTEGETVDLATLAGVSEGDFYYGSIDGAISLTPCSQAVIQDGELQPLDESGDTVSGEDIYLAYDELYSFDVAVKSVVNEHTEDNGDAYLWVGDTFYIDQYHSQGVYLTGYSNNATETADCGIWPMLGRTREPLINNGTYEFEHWMGQDLNTWEKVKVYDGVTGNDLTKSASGKDNGDKNYGIVGPFQFTDGETDITTGTVRVTGRIGDEFTASEVIGSGDVYMIREDSDYREEWYNLGSHASDNGKRAWFYWINKFYILNNYQDLLEYVQIAKDEQTEEVRLLADEIGEEGSGELIDVWDLEGIYIYQERCRGEDLYGGT